MREIKFRAWEKDGFNHLGEPTMVDWNELQRNYNLNAIMAGDWVRSDKYILMQYTGLHDKNGKEIYEGDILKEGEYIGTVYYDEAEGSYFIEPLDEKWDYLLLGTNAFGMEVVGNTCENPLLEG